MNTCIAVFIATLFTTDKICNQAWCQSADGRIVKMCYKGKVEYYSSTKKNGIPNFAAKLIDLQVIMLSKITQTGRKILCYSFIFVSKKFKLKLEWGLEI